jgi:hypothetical protein
VLIRRADLDAIVAGNRDLAFRRWNRPTVKTGGTLTTVVGVLAIDAVDRIEASDVTDAEAIRAGFESRGSLLAELAGRPGDLYRIRLHWSGEDPRVALRERAEVSSEEMSEIRARLERYDAASRNGPWTLRTLGLILNHPETLAATLAATEGWKTAWFKANVRKLKALGLTESLEIGYRLSPRGAAFLHKSVASR